uniref:Uncharacterized protein n=1 Tax=Romanomermis culicivorax TaxID=13658 RepID=A0A915L7Q3_ROMCU
MAAEQLRIGGRLVYWLPILYKDHDDSSIPRHSALTLIFKCEQKLSSSHGRLLICMEKINNAKPDNKAYVLRYSFEEITLRDQTSVKGHLYLPFRTERNGMQWTESNRTKGIFSVCAVWLEPERFKLLIRYVPFDRKKLCFALQKDETDGVHWHMARVAGAVFMGETFTFWKWAKSSNNAMQAPTIALWTVCTINDENDEKFITMNFKIVLPFCIAWLVLHAVYLAKTGFYLGETIYHPKKQTFFNWLIQGDALASTLIGCTWIAFPNLILQKQVKFTLDPTHFLVSRCFGVLLFSTHFFSTHAICCGILAAQIYSQVAYRQWWTRGHWIGASLFSIWTGLVVWAALQQNLNKFA